jgi:hypothetical protein
MTTTPPTRLLNKPLNKQTKGNKMEKLTRGQSKKALQNIIPPYLTLSFFPTYLLLVSPHAYHMHFYYYIYIHTCMHLHAFTCIFYKLIMQKYRHLVLMESRPNRPIFTT